MNLATLAKAVPATAISLGVIGQTLCGQDPEVAQQLEEIAAAEQRALEPFELESRLLDQRFHEALTDLARTSAMDLNHPRSRAAKAAISKLEGSAPWEGLLADPEIRRLTGIYRKARQSVNASNLSSILKIEGETRNAYVDLQQALREQGRLEGVQAVGEAISRLNQRIENRQLIDLQLREPIMENPSLPSIMRNREKREMRMESIAALGGTEAAERAVVAGLRHLKSTQNPDGSWGSSYPHAMTGLAILAFLGHGDGPWSNEFGNCTVKAIEFLIDHSLANRGIFASGPEPNPMPYEHAIATFALAEATTLCAANLYEVPGLASATGIAGQHIIDKQHQSGGWDYGYKTKSSRGGDLSITAWQFQALHACQQTSLDFKDLNSCIRNGLDYVAQCQRSDGGFRYTSTGGAHSPNGYATLTGAGMLTHQLFGEKSSAAVRKAAKYIQRKSKFDYQTSDADLYGHFYEARAMLFRGGEDWKRYHEIVFPSLIEAQGPDGSWPKPGNGQKLNAVAARYESDPHYRNCLCLLILETYYRDARPQLQGHDQ